MMKLDRDHAALMLMEILFEQGLVNKETLQAARQACNQRQQNNRRLRKSRIKGNWLAVLSQSTSDRNSGLK